MANYYVMHSTAVELCSKKEYQWVKDEFNFVETFNSECDELGIDPEDHPRYSAFQKYLEDYELESEEEGLEVFMELDLEEGSFCISSENGGVDQAATFFHRFLKEFYPYSYIMISWAGYCEKLRPGEHEGGAFFVTAKKIEHMTSLSWLQDKAKRHNKKFESGNLQKNE